MPNGYAKAIKDRPMWVCASCGKSERPTARQTKQTYCSYKCMSDGYKERMKGRSNPNYKAAAQKVCNNCGQEFKSYTSGKYCSRQCYTEKRREKAAKPCKSCGKMFLARFSGQVFCDSSCKPKTRPIFGPKADGRRTRHPQLYKDCLFCGSQFKYSPSQSSRKYCSYPCFNNDGGNIRAGAAGTISRMKYGAKKDANHKQVFDEIRKHTAAQDLSAFGNGVPDGAAWVVDGWQFFDVKNINTSYGRRGLNKLQKKWASDWRGGPVYLIHDEVEAEKFAKGDFRGIKCHPEEKHPLHNRNHNN